jgi:hypothetical protein
MSRPRPGASPKPLSRARQRARASWIFSSVLLAFLMAVVIFAPERLAGFKQQLLAVLAALLAGFMAFFLTGDLGIERSGLKASGGLGAFALMLFLWPKIVPAPGPEIYRLRVTVLGTQGQPVEDAKVSSSVGGEIKMAAGGWELDIPAATLPADRKVTIRAVKDFAQGSREVILEKDYQPAITVELKEDRSAKISGRVEDRQGRSVEGARVWVEGYEAEAVASGAKGEFTLAAHAVAGKEVRLHLRKAGLEPPPQDHPAGSGPVTLRLE